MSDKNKYKLGSKVRIKRTVSENGDYHKYRGQIGTITEYRGWYGNISQLTMKDGHVLRNVGYSVVEPISDDFSSIDELREQFNEKNEEIKNMEAELDLLNEKIQFVEKYNLDEFDVRVFKAFKIYEVVNQEGEFNIEKAKQIARVLDI